MFKKTKHINFDQLLARYYRGDSSALSFLIRQYHPKMQRLVMHHTNNKNVIDDIAQDCWYDIIRFLERDELKINFEALAYTIIRRKCIDWIRKQQSERKKNIHFEPELDSLVSENADDEKDESQLEAIQLGLAKLPEAQRLILTMFYIDNRGIREISKTIKIPVGTVKSRLFTARESLKKIIHQKFKTHDNT